MGRLITVKEAARELGVSPWVVYRLVRENLLPGVVRLGKRRVVLRRDVVEAWLRGEQALPGRAESGQ
jgi:excisionase family DNA binding protein